MTSPGEDIQSWSTTAGNNGTADPLIVWSEGQARASVNNSARSEMAAHAKNRNLLNGSIVTTGSPNAQQFLSGLTYTTIPSGLRATLKVGAGLTNDASLTLNMDGLGDTLVKTASGDNLAGREFIADAYVDVLYNGTNWIFLYSREFFFELMAGGGGLILGIQKFSTAGTFTYTPTAGAECIICECIGGGGGGGNASASALEFFGGGGGGSGGYSRKVLTAADIGTSQQVIVGVGGIGGTGLPLGTGGDGGDSYIGAALASALCAAKGGKGGEFGTAGTIPGGGAGGAIVDAVGDLVAAGAPGSPGFDNRGGQAIYKQSGEGGSSTFGGGGKSVRNSNNGTDGSNYGSGGGGACSYNADVKVGGSGSAGIIIITEFAGRGSPGRDGDTGPIGPPGPSGPGTGDVLRAGTPTAGQYAVWTDASHIQGIAAPIASAPARTVYTSGSGTYTTPVSCRWLEIELAGGGAGGSGSNAGGVGTAGGNTTFGTLAANGADANPSYFRTGAPGTASGGQVNIRGGYGNDGMDAAASSSTGGIGGSTRFGGAGNGGTIRDGGAAAANTGAGGGGGGTLGSTIPAGAGGSSGGYCSAVIGSPAATYAYAVGTGGTGGAAGASGCDGGAGGAGIIIITAFF